MGTIVLSVKERRRLELLAQVREGKLALVKAAGLMNVSYRQAKRIWKRYRCKGDEGLVHRSRGRPSRRRVNQKVRMRILNRYRARYGDFGPTLAVEHLSKEGFEIDHETLRRWLIQEGLWLKRRQRQKHRQWRERKQHQGELVQMDGSHHDWFEGRRAPAVLMVMIDDATNRTYARFFEQETTAAAYETFGRYGRQWGIPSALYVDRDSIYRTNREPTIEEQLRGQQPKTQFGRAMEQLGVQIILAQSPQAKGRVERRNAVFQDRLVKELRLAKISDLNRANAFLEQTFLPELNRRFTLVPAKALDLHRQVPKNLEESLSWEEQRVVGHDWVVVWERRWFQIAREHESLCLAGKSVTVRQLQNGQVQLLYQGQKLRWKELPDRPARKVLPKKKPVRRASQKPVTHHPWRRFGFSTGKVFWREIKRSPRAAQNGPAVAK